MGPRPNVAPDLSNLLAALRSKITGGGYTGNEKEAAALGQTLPGAPSPGTGEFVDPAAERYAGQYLQAHRGGSPLFAGIANQFALSDLFQSAAEKLRRKKAGETGFITGYNRRLLGQPETR